MAEITVRRLERSELAKVVALHAADVRRISREVLEWEYFDPYLAREGFIVGAFDGEALIGTQAFIPYRALWRGQETLSCKSELTMLSPHYRGLRLFDRMYEVGFRLCEEAGVGCVWGFTSATKPFAKIGFSIGAEIYQERLVWSPVRTALALKTRRSPRLRSLPSVQSSDLFGMANSLDHEFSLIRDRAYLWHRYVANPRRRIACIDQERGVLCTYGGAREWIVNVSEAVSRGHLHSFAVEHGRFLRKHFLVLQRFCTVPAFRWQFVPSAIPIVRNTGMKVVFKWLGPRTANPPPTLDVEEGYSEGVI